MNCSSKRSFDNNNATRDFSDDERKKRVKRSSYKCSSRSEDENDNNSDDDDSWFDTPPKRTQTKSTRIQNEHPTVPNSTTSSATITTTSNKCSKPSKPCPEVIDLFENSQLSTIFSQQQDEDGNDDDDDMEQQNDYTHNKRSMRTLYSSSDDDDDEDDDDEDDDDDCVLSGPRTKHKEPTWNCPKCTFENKSTSFSCSLCGTTMCEAIDDQDQHASTSTSKSTSTSEKVNQHTNHSNYWTCTKCTYAENKKDYLSCAMCSTERNTTIMIPSSAPSTPIITYSTTSSSTTTSHSSRSPTAPAIVTPSTETSYCSVSRRIHNPNFSPSSTTARRTLRARREICNDISHDNNNNNNVSPQVDEHIHDHYRYSVVQNTNNNNNPYYDAVLNQCNIHEGSNNNKYYRIQMLMNNTTGEYHVWNRWGRVGNSTTGCALKGPFYTEQSAFVEFASKYKQKSGNTWDAPTFIPKQKKYVKIDIDHGLNSKASAIKASLGFSVELKELPLGVLSRRQIQKGQEILDRIKAKLEGRGVDNDDDDDNDVVVSETYAQLSSQYYTTIPTPSALTCRPPAISNDLKLRQCYDKCQTLLTQVETLANYVKPEKKPF